MIPFFNYAELYNQNKSEYLKIIEDVCSRGAFILQSDLEEFEKNSAKFINVKHCIGVANGTDALWLGLKAAGVKPNDEIIIPSHTYIASAAAVHFVGAKPVLAECGDDNMLDVEDIEKRITKKTIGIMPVQINGRCCNMEEIEHIAKKNGIQVFEDSAQAFGSKFDKKYAGTFGLFGTFSFYPAKLLGCFGDGGALVTNDDDLAKKVKLLRDHGRNTSGEVVDWGFNSRLDNLQAAILNYKLKTYENDINRRREIAQMYDEGLRNIKSLYLPPPPSENSKYFDVYQNYELRAKNRDQLQNYLKREGIMTIIQWAGSPVHSFRDLGFKEVHLPKTDKFFEECLMLPMNMTLTNENVDEIISKIKNFYS